MKISQHFSLFSVLTFRRPLGARSTRPGIDSWSNLTRLGSYFCLNLFAEKTFSTWKMTTRYTASICPTICRWKSTDPKTRRGSTTTWGKISNENNVCFLSDDKLKAFTVNVRNPNDRSFELVLFGFRTFSSFERSEFGQMTKLDHYICINIFIYIYI